MLDGRWRAKVERGLEPVGKGLHRVGISADGLTIFGLAIAIVTAFAIADGHLVLGVIGVILTGVPDILDGSVARTSGRAGPRGAFFDSVCDRIADAALFLGVAWYLSNEDPRLPVLVMAVLALSMLITYERARAESLGLMARGGLMERAERMVLLGVGLAFNILVPVMWLMLVLTAFTALQRFVKVWRQATPEPSRRSRHMRGASRRRGSGRNAGAVVGGTASAATSGAPTVGTRRPAAPDGGAHQRRLSRLPRRSRGRAVEFPPRSASRWPAASRSWSGSGSCAHGCARSSATCDGSTDLASAASPGNAPSPPPSIPTGATSTSCSGFPAHRSRGSTRTRTSPACITSWTRSRPGTASCSRCRTSATGTSPARGSPGRATRSRWSPNRSSHPSSTSGSSPPAPSSGCA